VEQPEERIGADRHASFVRQASAAFAAGLQCERRQQFGRVECAPGVVGEHAIETLGEDLTWAIWYVAEPPSAVHSQSHGVAAPGQIERPPKVAAVLAPAQFAAPRAWNSLACRFGNQHQTAIVFYDHQNDLPVIRLSPK